MSKKIKFILAVIVLLMILVACGGSKERTIYFKDGREPVHCLSITKLADNADWIFCDQGTTYDGIPLKMAVLTWNIDRIEP